MFGNIVEDQIFDFDVMVQPNREDEYARIEAAGGKVIQWNGYRVFGVLAMSRSIGRCIFSRSWFITEKNFNYDCNC